MLEVTVYGVAATAGALAAIALAGMEIRRRTTATSAKAADVDHTDTVHKPTPSGSNTSYAATAVTCVLALFAVLGALVYTGSVRQLPWLRSSNIQSCLRPEGSLRIAPYGDLAGFSHPIITSASTAQQLFNLGLLQEWNFNQEEALHAFQQAAGEDPDAAMADWGQAYALGPGANRGVVDEPKAYPSFSPADFPACHEAVKQALQKAKAALERKPDLQLAQKELAYAEAAVLRFAAGSERQPARNAAERAYAEAMRDIGRRFADPHALAIAAEGFMNYYEGGALRPSAAEAEALILEVLKAEPLNPLALHLHIHIAEAASPLRDAPVSAARAEASADAMTELHGVRAAHLGHLIHMPSHTFVRIGRYHDAVEANVRAWEADYEDNQNCRAAYVPEHNMDLLVYAANMAGQVQVAKEYAQRLRTFNQDMPSSAYYDSSYAWTHLVTTLVMHGRWTDVRDIADKVPKQARALCIEGGYEYAQVVHHYARTLAMASQSAAAYANGRAIHVHLKEVTDVGLRTLVRAAAKVEREEPTVPGEGVGIYGCDHKPLTDIYVRMVQARLALLEGRPDDAEALLREAVAIEDGMGYMEPPRLYQPVRHCLGQVLLDQAKPAEAQQVFEADLQRNPNNGWALLGLVNSLKAQGKPSEQQEDAFAAAWAHADGPLVSSCLAYS